MRNIVKIKELQKKWVNEPNNLIYYRPKHKITIYTKLDLNMCNEGDKMAKIKEMVHNNQRQKQLD